MLIEELASAKVNLTLEILGRRPDGYHALRSVVAFASVGDVVVLDVDRAPGVSISGPFAPQLPSEFLIARTLQLLADRAPRLRLGAVRLDKRLPVAAGVGGGSADAAAVLRAVYRANPEFSNRVPWYEIAAELGADVPVCFANRLTEMSGIGEVLKPLPPFRHGLAAVLVNPQVRVPENKTARVFQALGAGALSNAQLPPLPALATGDDAVSVISAVGNDLERPAATVVPEIGDVLQTLRAMSGCRVARMSGAGPTCFAIVDDADAVAAGIRARQPTWWVEPATLS